VLTVPPAVEPLVAVGIAALAKDDDVPCVHLYEVTSPFHSVTTDGVGSLHAVDEDDSVHQASLVLEGRGDEDHFRPPAPYSAWAMMDDGAGVAEG
jgi:hypothetical protein